MLSAAEIQLLTPAATPGERKPAESALFSHVVLPPISMLLSHMLLHHFSTLSEF